MRAAQIDGQGGRPVLVDIAEPEGRVGASLISVIAGGGGSSDLQRANGVFGPITGSYVVGGEGVGRLASGERVYFGHSASPFGAWAERTLVPEAEVWPLPDSVDDGLAIALGISGTGALIALEEARIQPGERVLVLGATGPVGQLGLQLARLMGAGPVVAAARDMGSLERLRERGLADAVAQLGAGDDLQALKAVAGDGFDVVLDIIYGPPAEAAMRATRPGARMMSIGVQAGPAVTLGLRDLVMRSHVGVGTGQRPPAERRAAYGRLIDYATRLGLRVDCLEYRLEDAAQAWAAQSAGPRAKIIVRP